MAKNITQKRIAGYLGITEKTLIKLKKKHKKLEQAFIYGNDELKEKLVSAILRKAEGYTIPLKQQIAEDNKTNKNGKKNKVVLNEKHYPPDFNSARYLLIIKFGREWNERKEELDLMRERIEVRKEEWPDAIDN